MDKQAIILEYAKHCARLRDAVNEALEEVPAFFLQPVLAELAQGVAMVSQRQLAESMEENDAGLR